MPGDRLDSFELQEAIGVGGMGAVFRALDIRLDRFVALKVLPPEQADDPENVQRFYQEGRAAARLDHENIARVYNIGHDKSLHYIAFEYIEGTTIRQRVERQGPLSVAETINFTLQIASALVHASERGVVHRDIKPSNIIVTPHGRAKLVDMGLARRFEREGHDEGLTQSGMTLGTFDYISPEQARDPRSVDARSDLYSLGCTMYHMLTGRPPFPGGTVLQKLLSHQEDPAPDVRGLNASVPPDLAAVILKLMAKDPDRRYQTPEQLVRDLLTMAGSLGLRSLSPEGLVWLHATPPPSWERHLYWGLPAVTLALVVAGLVWWGQDGITFLPEGPAQQSLLARSGPAIPPDVLERPVDRDAPEAEGPSEAPALAARSRSPDASGAAEPTGPEPPRELTLAASDDMRSVLDSAPSGSTLILLEDGPYELRPAEPGSPPLRGDLTIQAGPDVHPIVRSVGGLDGEPEDVPALLHFEGARVAITGLTFELSPVDDIAPRSAIQATNTALKLQNCSFRRPVGGVDLGVTAALELEAEPLPRGRRPAAPVQLYSCHIDGGQAGIVARGSVDVELRDCTIAGAQPALWLDNAVAETPVPAWLWMDHVSIQAGDEPVLRFLGTEARVQVHDSLVAPPRDGSLATLVSIDDSRRLEWSGRGNLYARVGTYLRSSDQPSIRDFASWVETSPHQRGEADSLSLSENVWHEDDPSAALARGALPSRAFRLAPFGPALGTVGAREGPLASLLSPSSAVGINAWSPAPAGVGSSATEDRPTRGTPSEPPAMIFEPLEPEVQGESGVSIVEAEESLPLGLRPQEDVEPGPVEDRRPAFVAEFPSERAGDPLEDAEAVPTDPPSDRGPAEPDRPSTIRTARELREALGSSDSHEIRLSADADLTLSTTEIRGPGRWEIKAEPGLTRPRLRFRPSNSDLAKTTVWPVLFHIRPTAGGGRLQLQGVDIILREEDAPNMGRWAVFGMGSGTVLNLIDCTVTVEGNERSAIVRVQASEEDAGAGVAAPAPSTASIRVSNSLLRCGDDVVDVSAGRRLDLKLDNAVVASGGSLLHGHGLPRGLEPVLLNLELDKVTALAEGGIVWLESAIGEPDLPVVTVVAIDSAFSTSPERGPLFRVDGQEDLDALRDRIRYNMHNVAYHDMDIYLRVQTDRPGAGSQNVDRNAWEIAVGDRDEAAYHGEVLFADAEVPERPPWLTAPESLRIDPESPAASSGSDLGRIPAAPAQGEARSGPLDELQRFIKGLELRSQRQ